MQDFFLEIGCSTSYNITPYEMWWNVLHFFLIHLAQFLTRVT